MADSTKSANSSSSSNNNNLTRLAVRGTLVTLLFRLVSFACTQWTLRFIHDPKILGRASIQLELLLSTVLFVSREGFRLALTKNISTAKNNGNVAWLTLPTTWVISLLACVWHLRHQQTTTQNDNDDADYRLAGILFCFACAIEGTAEPAVLEALRRMDIATKATAEGLATVGKTVTTVIALHFLQANNWPVTAFGVAQLAYALVYASYLWRMSWPKVNRSHMFGPYESSTCLMVLIYTLQGFFKHILTEGDKLVLTALSGAYDQGVYAMGSAYGGMAARILLQPVEENARLMWSRLGSSESSDTRQLQASYTDLVKLVLYVGFIFSCLAVNYTGILLSIMAGRTWGDNVEASRVLSAFCVYTAFMAWNGMAEAFVYSIASSGSDMGRLGAAHVIIGLLFAKLASVGVTKYGTVGLVAANCVAMSCRAIYSVIFAARYFSTKQQKGLFATLFTLLRDMFPHPVVQLAFVVCFVVTRWSLNQMRAAVLELAVVTASPAWFRLAGEHVAVGATCGVGLLTVVYVTENGFRRSLHKMWKGRTD
jgi:oligosaccharide translocation protein RFT1